MAILNLVENAIVGGKLDPKGTAARAEAAQVLYNVLAIIVLRCPVTDEEKALIMEKMALLKTKRIVAYLRKMAINGYIIQVDHSAIRENGAELQKIGTNINQIAKRINSTGTA